MALKGFPNIHFINPIRDILFNIETFHHINEQIEKNHELVWLLVLALLAAEWISCAVVLLVSDVALGKAVADSVRVLCMAVDDSPPWWNVGPKWNEPHGNKLSGWMIDPSWLWWWWCGCGWCKVRLWVVVDAVAEFGWFVAGVTWVVVDQDAFWIVLVAREAPDDIEEAAEIDVLAEWFPPENDCITFCMKFWSPGGVLGLSVIWLFEFDVGRGCDILMRIVFAVTPGLFANVPLPIFIEKGPLLWVLNEFNNGGVGCETEAVPDEGLFEWSCEVISEAVAPSGVGREEVLCVIPGGRPLAGICTTVDIAATAIGLGPDWKIILSSEIMCQQHSFSSFQATSKSIKHAKSLEIPKWHQCRSEVFFVRSEGISHLFLVFSSLTLSMYFLLG